MRDSPLWGKRGEGAEGAAEFLSLVLPWIGRPLPNTQRMGAFFRASQMPLSHPRHVLGTCLSASPVPGVEHSRPLHAFLSGHPEACRGLGAQGKGGVLRKDTEASSPWGTALAPPSGQPGHPTGSQPSAERKAPLPPPKCPSGYWTSSSGDAVPRTAGCWLTWQPAAICP